MQICFQNFRFGVTSFALLACCCIASISCAEGNTKDTFPAVSAVDAALQQRFANATKVNDIKLNETGTYTIGAIANATQASDVKSVGELAQVVQNEYWQQTLDIW